jgi:RHS repeat-associated protein
MNEATRAGVPPALVASFIYDAAGRETSRTYGNGLNTTSSYSRADNLITSITVAGKPELSFGYSYDSNKNVTAEQRGGSMALYSWSATFDAMDRLNSQNDGVQTRSWSLDLVGNTTSETLNGTAEARTLNDMHAPTAAGNKAYTYDSNGQMTTKPGVTMIWDARNHLVESVKSAQSVDYKYDAFGNRVSKGSTRYLLVDNQVLAEFNGSASKQYCYGSYIDEVLAEKGADVSYYHRNRQYNTSALTDSSGSVLEMYSTDAMGRVKAFDAAATAKVAPAATTVLFTGRVFDAETGLYYFRARYFEPELGVFISRDPLGFVDGQSVYQGWFAALMLSDHLGLAHDGHHMIPQSIWRGLVPQAVAKIFDSDEACLSDPCYKNHKWDKEHKEYNAAVRQKLEEFLASKGKSMSQLTADDAKEFLNSVINAPPGSAIKNFNDRMKREIKEAAEKAAKEAAKEAAEKGAENCCKKGLKFVVRKFPVCAVCFACKDVYDGGPVHAFNEFCYPLSNAWKD